jgi:hypothetical protein
VDDWLHRARISHMRERPNLNCGSTDLVPRRQECQRFSCHLRLMRWRFRMTGRLCLIVALIAMLAWPAPLRAACRTAEASAERIARRAERTAQRAEQWAERAGRWAEWRAERADRAVAAAERRAERQVERAVAAAERRVARAAARAERWRW